MVVSASLRSHSGLRLRKVAKDMEREEKNDKSFSPLKYIQNKADLKRKPETRVETKKC